MCVCRFDSSVAAGRAVHHGGDDAFPVAFSTRAFLSAQREGPTGSTGAQGQQEGVLYMTPK